MTDLYDPKAIEEVILGPLATHRRLRFFARKVKELGFDVISIEEPLAYVLNNKLVHHGISSQNLIGFPAVVFSEASEIFKLQGPFPGIRSFKITKEVCFPNSKDRELGYAFVAFIL